MSKSPETFNSKNSKLLTLVGGLFQSSCLSAVYGNTRSLIICRVVSVIARSVLKYARQKNCTWRRRDEMRVAETEWRTSRMLDKSSSLTTTAALQHHRTFLGQLETQSNCHTGQFQTRSVHQTGHFVMQTTSHVANGVTIWLCNESTGSPKTSVHYQTVVSVVSLVLDTLIAVKDTATEQL